MVETSRIVSHFLAPDEYEEVHGRADVQFPQLEMVRPDLEDLPEISLPPGYSMRHYGEGDEKAWGEIMSEAFTPFWDEARFNRFIRPHFGFRPERVIFICHGDTPVGSACAFRWPGLPPDCGYMHMVGVKKEHCGRGLGYWLALACLHRFREEGLGQALLQTEDFRLPAIRHYLRLGFKPSLAIEAHRDKWEHALCRIGGEELVQALEIAELPVMSRLGFWWRTALVTNYMSWLNLRYEFAGKG